MFNFITVIILICYLIIVIQLNILIVNGIGFKSVLAIEKFMEGLEFILSFCCIFRLDSILVVLMIVKISFIF